MEKPGVTEWGDKPGFDIRLEAVGGTNCRRAYRVKAVPDLFGVWIIETNFGRIGTAGRTITVSADTMVAARRLVQHAMRRRASAPKRIGVAYVVKSLIDPLAWTSEAQRHGDTLTPIIASRD